MLKEIAPALLENDGEGILIIDDLTDTGKTAGDRARHDAEGAFRHRLRQAEGPAAGRHVRHRSVAGHLDLFPWDMGFTYQKPIADDHARLTPLPTGTFEPVRAAGLTRQLSNRCHISGRQICSWRMSRAGIVDA